jgi:hypothetical protein
MRKLHFISFRTLDFKDYYFATSFFMTYGFLHCMMDLGHWLSSFYLSSSLSFISSSISYCEKSKFSSSLPLSTWRSIFASSRLQKNNVSVFYYKDFVQIYHELIPILLVLIIEIRFFTSQISLLCLSLTLKWPLLLNNQYWN